MKMGMFDTKYNYDELMRFGTSGIEVANFVDFRNALSNKYREIYGNDIDIDDTTADGQFIMMLSLMLYNGYNGVLQLNNSLDPAMATGKFLDILCSHSNIYRESAQKSTAKMYVYYTGGMNEYTALKVDNCQQIECIDKSGNIWVWKEGKNIDGDFDTVFKASVGDTGKIWSLTFTCEKYGPISAQANDTISNIEPTYANLKDRTDIEGWIYQTLDATIYPFKVWQAEDAVEGNYEESDESLRSRRIQEVGNNGITTLNGLVGSLIDDLGIVEAKVYNNNTGNNIKTNDLETVQSHDVYVLIRAKEGENLQTNVVANLIYENMTPGILTHNSQTSPTNNYLTKKAYSYEIEVYSSILGQMVYWAQCKGICPALKLEFIYNQKSFSVSGDDVVRDGSEEKPYTQRELTIIESIKNFTNGLTIFDDLVVTDLNSAINDSDAKENNKTNYIYTTGKVRKKGSTVSTIYNSNKIGTATENLSDTFTNSDTYYDYSKCTFEFTYTANSGSEFSNGVLEIYNPTV